ncbi:ChbG/HpnK family deacetylase [Aquabacterium sp.]|uniref:ChbG/HpnK family deacetylase n=1 Tax=Aquabacterium sp. TaxID=1872578 RepID=UPI004037A771
MIATAGAQRQLAVCVDDFGLHDGVNQAVFDLLALRRISAVSCLVDGPSWVAGATALREAVGQPDAPVADVGLHLNFTETLDVAAQSACPSQPLGALIQACYLRRLDVAVLAREIERQWDRFEACWGRAPDFIDGHQHAHQLPQIRDALLQVLRRRCPSGAAGPRPWVRQCRSPGWRAVLVGISVSDTVKAAIIGTLGATVLGRAVGRLGLRHSERLLGVYPFDADAVAYLRRWQAWLSLVRPQGDLLMCHPSVPMQKAPPWPDVIAPSRYMEHAVLTGEAFGALLKAGGVRIVRLGEASRL